MKELGNLFLMRSSMPVLLVLALIVGLSYFIKLNNQPQPCANSISCIKNLSGAQDISIQGEFMGQKVLVPNSVVAAREPPILGQNVGVEKRIFVDLTSQMLHAFEGDKLAFSFPVSTGKWYKTPTGDFRIWIKLEYTRMSGGDQRIGTYYNLPNVPHVMYFYNSEHPKTQGYGLHGAYWHNNFGHPMSHGCVNISLENAEKLYHWAEPVSVGNSTYATADNLGTPLTIYGQTPRE